MTDATEETAPDDDPGVTDTTPIESTVTDQTATIDKPTLKAICEQVDQPTERVGELEAQLTKYTRFAGSEFADVRGRVDDIEE